MSQGAVKAYIIDPTTGDKARVQKEGVLNVVTHPHPPKGETIDPLPFRQYLTDDGTSSGDNDMLVDGSTNNVDYYVQANGDYDIYIGRIDILIADASAVLNKFGNITALTNGVLFQHESQRDGITVIHEGLKSNFDFVRLAGGKPPFGDGAGAFRAGNMFGASEGYLPCVDFDEIFNLRWGLRLRKGTNDRIVMRVRDDVTGIDAFNAQCYGIKF